MMRDAVLLVLGVLLATGCGQAPQKKPLEVTYIANEGFMVSMGGTTMLIDALPSSQYYANPSDTLAFKLTHGIPPFDNVEYALVTHDHPDHFNAGLMSSFLRFHPAAQLIACSEACGKLTGDSLVDRQRTGLNLTIGQQQTIRTDNAAITVMRLAHGSNPNINDFAFIVQSEGYTIMHVGDAILAHNEEYLRTIDWSSYTVDVLFLEFFDQSSQTQEILKNLIKPKHVVLMHIPAGEEESVRIERGKIHPRTVVFGKENEMRRFDGDPGSTI